MKILQVIDRLNVGGAEKVFVDICTILYEKNPDTITAFFLLDKGKLSDKLPHELKKIELNRNDKWSLKKMSQCAQIIKEYDIIHCHFRHVYKYIRLVSFLFNCKVEILLHDHYGSIMIDKKIPFLMDTLLKPKHYIGVSSTLCDWAREKLLLDFNSVYLLENIVLKSKEHKKYPFKNLVLVSNIKAVKNNLFAVEIMKSLSLSLVLIGNNQDNDYFNLVNNKIHDENLRCSIDSTITNVQEVLRNFSLGLHTSISESGPLVLIEYLAQGLPFLAYETGEVATILKPHFPDYFIDNFDSDLWKERIEMLLNKKHDINKMKQIFETYFGSENYYNKLIAIYKCIKN
ncbi:Glycosyltransferase involved in cell wall bisynthesis [Flavobacterium sp. 9AF]|uniref:glycosyltransferase family 4 protein n=1 Tax=Flavobacterium sp. 9AF TaxID=2653142 RepID=UPI0012F00037|nr:glycosyltransferase family 4 protein [Flavobacterium sp. 9AF]VXC31740.1 Glycosyltransferase involved in cell wall bisynthesis [Flavobacterium sp. 9AF]